MIIMESLQGNAALITGAGKGVARAMAKALAIESVSVGLVASTESDLPEVTEEITRASGKTAFATADVCDINEVNTSV